MPALTVVKPPLTHVQADDHRLATSLYLGATAQALSQVMTTLHTGLLLSGGHLTGGGGGGVRGQKQVCVSKINLKFPAPLMNFVFHPRTIFLVWVGG